MPELFDEFQFQGKDLPRTMTAEGRYELVTFLRECRLWFPVTRNTHALAKVVVERRENGGLFLALLVGPLYHPIMASDKKSDEDFHCLFYRQVFVDVVKYHCSHLSGFQNTFPSYHINLPMHPETHISLEYSFLMQLLKGTCFDKIQIDDYLGTAKPSKAKGAVKGSRTSVKSRRPTTRQEPKKNVKMIIVNQIVNTFQWTYLLQELGRQQAAFHLEFGIPLSQDDEENLLPENRMVNSLQYRIRLMDMEKDEDKFRAWLKRAPRQDKDADRLLDFVQEEMQRRAQEEEKKQPKIMKWFAPKTKR